VTFCFVTHSTEYNYYHYCYARLQSPLHPFILFSCALCACTTIFTVLRAPLVSARAVRVECMACVVLRPWRGVDRAARGPSAVWRSGRPSVRAHLLACASVRAIGERQAGDSARPGQARDANDAAEKRQRFKHPTQKGSADSRRGKERRKKRWEKEKEERRSTRNNGRVEGREYQKNAHTRPGPNQSAKRNI